MDILPNDCLYAIFKKLDCPKDRESFGLTCREWLRIQSSSRRSLQFICSYRNQPQGRLFQAQPENGCSDIIWYKISRLLIRFRQLKSLTIVGWYTLLDTHLSLLELCGSTLRALYLRNCFQITDDGISYVAHGCRLLSIFSLSWSKVTDNGLHILASCCTSLTRIDLSESQHITDDAIAFLIQNCHGLHSLDISHCRKITGTGFKECPKTLTFLEAEACNLVPEGVIQILRGGGLEYLSLCFLRKFIFGGGLTDIESGIASRLRVLDLMYVGSVGNEAITAIAMGCPLMQEWNLNFCLKIGRPGWESIGLNCHNLERLHVIGCLGLCEMGLKSLRDGCTRLSILYIGTHFSHFSSLAHHTFSLLRPNVELNYEPSSYIAFPREEFFQLEEL